MPKKINTGSMQISAENERIGPVTKQVERISQNLQRVTRLVKIYEKIRGSGRGRRTVYSLDILRAGVVLLHASLEDFLRSLAAIFLPTAEGHILDSIPLADAVKTRRPEKFFLGKLVAHRGKTVDELITESVYQYLEYSNYSNAKDITSLLQNIGINPDSVKDSLPDVVKIIQRRHQIVHRADRALAKGSGNHSVQSINPDQVRAWTGVIFGFMKTILEEIENKLQSD